MWPLSTVKTANGEDRYAADSGYSAAGSGGGLDGGSAADSHAPDFADHDEPVAFAAEPADSALDHQKSGDELVPSSHETPESPATQKEAKRHGGSTLQKLASDGESYHHERYSAQQPG